jgi:hypothetical protein
MNVDEFLRNHAPSTAGKRSRKDEEDNEEEEEEEQRGMQGKRSRLHKDKDEVVDALAGLTAEQRRLLEILDAGDEVCSLMELGRGEGDRMQTRMR